jgi:hypothetical protein
MAFSISQLDFRETFRGKLTYYQMVHEIAFMSEGKTIPFVRYVIFYVCRIEPFLYLSVV